MKRKISTMFLALVLLLCAVMLPLSAFAANDYGDESTFGANWALDGLYSTELWSGTAKSFSNMDYPLEIPVYFVTEGSSMVAKQDNNNMLSVVKNKDIWGEFGVEYNSGLKLDDTLTKFYDQEEYGPSAHKQGSTYVLGCGVYACYPDVAYATPDCLIIVYPDASDNMIVADASSGLIFTLSKPWVNVEYYEYGYSTDGTWNSATGATRTRARYGITADTVITLPDSGFAFDACAILSVSGMGDTDECSKTYESGASFAACELNTSDYTGEVYEGGYVISFYCEEDIIIDVDFVIVRGEEMSYAPVFSDVDDGAYYAEPVEWAVANGITDGTSNTTFSPEQTCTRGQIITFLWRAAGCPVPQRLDYFSDVDIDSYYAPAAAWAKEQGMAEGSKFSPEAPCTREMAVEFMWKQSGSPAASAAGFTDVSSPAVNWAVANGVTDGTSDTTFSPKQTCTRGQIVTFLFRAFA